MNTLFCLLKKVGFYIAASVFVITGMVYLRDYQNAHQEAQIISDEVCFEDCHAQENNDLEEMAEMENGEVIGSSELSETSGFFSDLAYLFINLLTKSPMK